jgi:hypothetical protein
MIPASSSILTRREQGDGDKPTFSASWTFWIAPSF